jgi:hypothetical protein
VGFGWLRIRVQWRDFVNIIMKLNGFPENMVNVFTG